MHCPNCHTENRHTANFCKRCGYLLAAQCPRCNRELPPEPDFCDHCGLALTSRAQAQWGFDAPASTLQAQTPIAPRPAPPVATPSPAPQPVAQTPSGMNLDQFIPQELAAKLEAVRDGGAMVGERRVVTMLFCDVKGSTAAAEQLDPEEWTDIINGAFAHMIAPIYTYEGTVARMMGDGILAFFGAPIAHEDDPERAVLAGLEIVEGIAAYRKTVQQNTGIDFNVRVGINTGLVVVGAVGSDLRMEYTAMGDAINLAARMEQTAEPGTVQIAADTHKHIQRLFEFEELGGIAVKGKSEPVDAYRVLRRRALTQSQRGIEGRRVPLVGRDRELSMLTQSLDIVRNGVGHIVTLLGDAGLGKTRLTREAWNALGDPDSVEWFGASSLSYESTQPYGLFQRLIRRLNDISPTDPAATVREKFAPLVELVDEADRPRVRLVMETLFNVHEGDNALEGEAFKSEFFAVMPILWRKRFVDHPTVLVFDDLHWSDPASIDLLVHLLALTAEIPLGIVCAFRPERQAPAWRIKTIADEEYHHRYTEITLRPLSDEHVDQIIDGMHIVGLPEELRAVIRERAGGNPFFVEEVVRSLIDADALIAEADKLVWHSDADPTQIDIPGNLQSLLAARIDRLTEDTRQVLQHAAVIGRSFYQRILETIGGDSANARAADLDQQLRMLLRLEMIREAARLPEIEYRFSNPLTQEVAYQTILIKRRRELHRRVGEAMEAIFADQLTELAPRLAYHFGEAKEADRAFHYYALAGDTAYRLYAHSEAITNYQQAIEWVDQANADSETIASVYKQLGRTLELISDYSGALKTYEVMEALAESRDDRPLKLAALMERGKIYVTMNPEQNPERGQSVADEALALARELSDVGAEAQIHWTLQLYHLYSDLIAQAVYHGEQALDLARQTPLDERRGLILNDVLRSYIMSGELANVPAMLAEASAAWQEIGNATNLVDVHFSAATLAQVRGENALALDEAQRTVELAESSGNLWAPATVVMNVARVHLDQGDIDAVLERSTQAIEHAHRHHHPSARSDILGTRALAVGRLGQFETAQALAKESLTIIKEFFPIWLILPETVLARLAIWEGDLDQARHRLEAIRETRNAENSWVMFWYPYLLACAELDVTAGDYEKARAAMLPFAARLRETGYFSFLPEALYWLGRAQIGLGAVEAARESLREAAQFATRMEHRLWLWAIFASLAQISEDDAERAALLAKSREVIDFIADHAGSDENRASFLACPQIAAIMQGVGEAAHD